MKKKLLFAVFALIILAIPFYIIMGSEDVLENGHLHKLRLRGYDPFDPFRGKYLRLNYDDRIPYEGSFEEGDDAFVILEKDSLGFSNFAKAVKNKPDNQDYINAEVLYVDEAYLQIKADHLGKYFINEDKAKLAELVVIEFTRKRPDDIYVAIRVLDGEARLVDIFIENTPLLEYIKKK